MSKEHIEAKQFVVFKLGEQNYGIDITSVQIIEKIKNIMRVPKASEYVEGIMNLRGDIIPVINIRRLFEMSEVGYSEETRIIIIKLEESLVGMIVDGVKEVIDLSGHQIEGVQNVQPLNNQYILGIGKVEEEDMIITLLNLGNVINDAFRIKENE